MVQWALLILISEDNHCASLFVCSYPINWPFWSISESRSGLVIVLTSQELFWILTNEVYKESITLVHIIQAWTCDAWWWLSLAEFWLTFWDLLNVHSPEQLSLGVICLIIGQTGSWLICPVCGGLWLA